MNWFVKCDLIKAAVLKLECSGPERSSEDNFLLDLFYPVLCEDTHCEQLIELPQQFYELPTMYVFLWRNKNYPELSPCLLKLTGKWNLIEQFSPFTSTWIRYLCYFQD